MESNTKIYLLLCQEIFLYIFFYLPYDYYINLYLQAIKILYNVIFQCIRKVELGMLLVFSEDNIGGLASEKN
jgi:hypothetical protein